MRPNFLQFIRPLLFKRQRKKLVLFIFLVAAFIFRLTCWKAVEWLFQVPHILTADEIGLSKCPACFGVNTSLCQSILDGEITVKTNGFWTNEYTKGVMYGRWKNMEVVVKYLASTSEIAEFDRHICTSAGMNSKLSCDLKSNVWSSFLANETSVKKMLYDGMDCTFHRLLQKIIGTYSKSEKGLTGEEKLYLSTALHLNQEVILLQVFPKKDGWPFPTFYGACGRVIVVENVGKNLKSLDKKPWPVRAKIALNLIKLALKLGSGEVEDWVLYLGDPLAENFGVNEKGDVVLLDMEHILVADRRQMTKKMNGATCPDNCPSNKPECLQYSPSDLCNGICRDHNLYALCQGVLADMKGRQGLLHSAPGKKLRVKLNQLLQDCVSGENGRREDVMSKIAKNLENQIFVN
ncbi:divergent protein kinase domain 2A-like [Actinia tenebrosa]|uniref:Divergent protein kinase domain 2A-like n=1 Tax=Actinia tenebrosa TaxID=6105 RepID=A0A6P8I2U6_ACTTE|nr:divergent protein kinase domain 2A-like [Actinia tenebrosa]